MASAKAEELATELGVDLGSVTGSGKDGNVLVTDVRVAARELAINPPDEIFWECHLCFVRYYKKNEHWALQRKNHLRRVHNLNA